jgi:hypothetical protein
MLTKKKADFWGWNGSGFIKQIITPFAKSTGSSKKDAGIVETYHSKTAKYIKMIQVLKCGEKM